MDELRPGWHEDERGGEDEIEPSFDDAVLHRLAAYG